MSNNTAKRLAQNTLFMYFRMGFLMIISLYTSRVVLNQLGVEDYGVYSLVGSIVAMFTSLRGLFASSTQRFLNYEMGRDAYDKLKVVFNMSILINLIIAIFFIICVEVVGYWFFNYKINIDPDRLFAAKWVFQFSIISVVISILTTPFDAVIIAHERMNIYAAVSILEGLLKLAIVYALTIVSVDKLIFYGFLQVVVSIIIICINVIYCNMKYRESRICKCWDTEYFKSMSSFAGWNFLGNTAYSLTQSGLNMVLNVFGGPVINAARGIAYQVQTITNTFLTNVNIVVNPYFIKTYSSGEISKVFSFLYLSSKIYFFIQFILTVIFCFFSFEILSLWLGKVPDYTITFMNLILVNCLIRSLHYPLDALFKAVGKLKWYQIFEGIILSMPLIASFLGLKVGYDYAFVFVSVILFEIVNFIVIVFLAHRVGNLKKLEYFYKVVFPCLFCSIVGVVFFVFMPSFNSFSYKLLYTFFCLLISIFIMWYVGFSKAEKANILTLVRK